MTRQEFYAAADAFPLKKRVPSIVCYLPLNPELVFLGVPSLKDTHVGTPIDRGPLMEPPKHYDPVLGTTQKKTDFCKPPELINSRELGLGFRVWGPSGLRVFWRWGTVPLIQRSTEGIPATCIWV